MTTLIKETSQQLIAIKELVTENLAQTRRSIREINLKAFYAEVEVRIGQILSTTDESQLIQQKQTIEVLAEAVKNFENTLAEYQKQNELLVEKFNELQKQLPEEILSEDNLEGDAKLYFRSYKPEEGKEFKEKLNEHKEILDKANEAFAVRAAYKLLKEVNLNSILELITKAETLEQLEKIGSIIMALATINRHAEKNPNTDLRLSQPLENYQRAFEELNEPYKTRLIELQIKAQEKIQENNLKNIQESLMKKLDEVSRKIIRNFDKIWHLNSGLNLNLFPKDKREIASQQENINELSCLINDIELDVKSFKEHKNNLSKQISHFHETFKNSNDKDVLIYSRAIESKQSQLKDFENKLVKYKNQIKIQEALKNTDDPLTKLISDPVSQLKTIQQELEPDVLKLDLELIVKLETAQEHEEFLPLIKKLNTKIDLLNNFSMIKENLPLKELLEKYQLIVKGFDFCYTEVLHKELESILSNLEPKVILQFKDPEELEKINPSIIGLTDTINKIQQHFSKYNLEPNENLKMSFEKYKEVKDAYANAKNMSEMQEKTEIKNIELALADLDPNVILQLKPLSELDKIKPTISNLSDSVKKMESFQFEHPNFTKSLIKYQMQVKNLEMAYEKRSAELKIPLFLSFDTVDIPIRKLAAFQQIADSVNLEKISKAYGAKDVFLVDSFKQAIVAVNVFREKYKALEQGPPDEKSLKNLETLIEMVDKTYYKDLLQVMFYYEKLDDNAALPAQHDLIAAVQMLPSILPGLKDLKKAYEISGKNAEVERVEMIIQKLDLTIKKMDNYQKQLNGTSFFKKYDIKGNKKSDPNTIDGFQGNLKQCAYQYAKQPVPQNEPKNANDDKTEKDVFKNYLKFLEIQNPDIKKEWASIMMASLWTGDFDMQGDIVVVLGDDKKPHLQRINAGAGFKNLNNKLEVHPHSRLKRGLVNGFRKFPRSWRVSKDTVNAIEDLLKINIATEVQTWSAELNLNYGLNDLQTFAERFGINKQEIPTDKKKLLDLLEQKFIFVLEQRKESLLNFGREIELSLCIINTDVIDIDRLKLKQFVEKHPDYVIQRLLDNKFHFRGKAQQTDILKELMTKELLTAYLNHLEERVENNTATLRSLHEISTNENFMQLVKNNSENLKNLKQIYRSYIEKNSPETAKNYNPQNFPSIVDYLNMLVEKVKNGTASLNDFYGISTNENILSQLQKEPKLSQKFNTIYQDFINRDAAALMKRHLELVQDLKSVDLLAVRTDRGKHKDSSLLPLSKFFNDLSDYVVEDILSYKNVEQRSLALKHWVNVAMSALNNHQHKDFTVAYAIHSAVIGTAISRLKNTFAGCDETTKENLQYLSNIFNSETNYKNSREAMNNSVVPIVPYFGSMMTDMTFNKDGNVSWMEKLKPQSDKELADNIENYTNAGRKTAVFIQVIKNSIEKVPAINDFNSSLFVAIQQQKPKTENYEVFIKQLSLTLEEGEKRNPQAEKINKMHTTLFAMNIVKDTQPNAFTTKQLLSQECEKRVKKYFEDESGISDLEQLNAILLDSVVSQQPAKEALDSVSPIKLEQKKIKALYEAWKIYIETGSVNPLYKKLDQFIKALDQYFELLLLEESIDDPAFEAHKYDETSKKLEVLKNTLSVDSAAKEILETIKQRIPDIEEKFKNKITENKIYTDIANTKPEKAIVEGSNAGIYLVKQNEMQWAVRKPMTLDESWSKEVEQTQKLFQNQSIVDNPNIVTVHSIFNPASQKYDAQVMEFCEAGSLFDKPMPLKALAGLSTQMFNGLAELHKAGFSHNDVKPDNFFLTKDGIVKLGDFGAIRPLNEVIKTPEGARQYLPPEFFEKNEFNAEKADIYAFGVTLYNLIFGGDFPELKKEKNNNSYFFPEVEKLEQLTESDKKLLDDLLSQCLETDPEKRPNLKTIAEHDYFKIKPVLDLKPSESDIERYINARIKNPALMRKKYVHAIVEAEGKVSAKIEKEDNLDLNKNFAKRKELLNEIAKCFKEDKIAITEEKQYVRDLLDNKNPENDLENRMYQAYRRKNPKLALPEEKTDVVENVPERNKNPIELPKIELSKEKMIIAEVKQEKPVSDINLKNKIPESNLTLNIKLHADNIMKSMDNVQKIIDEKSFFGKAGSFLARYSGVDFAGYTDPQKVLLSGKLVLSLNKSRKAIEEFESKLNSSDVEYLTAAKAAIAAKFTWIYDQFIQKNQLKTIEKFLTLHSYQKKAAAFDKQPIGDLRQMLSDNKKTLEEIKIWQLSLTSDSTLISESFKQEFEKNKLWIDELINQLKELEENLIKINLLVNAAILKKEQELEELRSAPTETRPKSMTLFEAAYEPDSELVITPVLTSVKQSHTEILTAPVPLQSKAEVFTAGKKHSNSIFADQQSKAEIKRESNVPIPKPVQKTVAPQVSESGFKMISEAGAAAKLGSWNLTPQGMLSVKLPRDRKSSNATTEMALRSFAIKARQEYQVSHKDPRARAKGCVWIAALDGIALVQDKNGEWKKFKPSIFERMEIEKKRRELDKQKEEIVNQENPDQSSLSKLVK